MRYSLSEPAQRDIREIAEFVAADNVGASHKLLKEFVDVFESLSLMPLLGRARDSVLLGSRSIGIGSYVVFYRIKSDVEILRVIHSARDVEKVLKSTDEAASE